jgi:RNA polymerase sigma factor (sigma-70 family)
VDRGARRATRPAARNLAIKRLRGDRRRVRREETVARPEGVPSDADVLERERLRRGVVDAVLALPEPYRATLLLRYFEDLPPREIARRTGVPVETVRTRTRRAISPAGRS